nr:immunoglobulin heavy chain junction region [Mus musculus]
CARSWYYGSWAMDYW